MTNTDMSKDQIVSLEMNLREVLTSFVEYEPFDLKLIIRAMFGETSHERHPSVDAIVRDRLLSWNWACVHDHPQNPTFQRRGYPTAPKIIRPAKGRMFGTKHSWPPYG